MTLKTKVLLIISVTLIVFCLLFIIINKNIVYSGFIQLENSQVEKDMERIHQAFLMELINIDSLCHDWASWDDAYDFVQTRSPKFIEVNLIPQTFSVNKLNLLYYLNRQGEVVWGQIYDLNDMNILQLSEFPDKKFPPGHSLAAPEPQEGDPWNESLNEIFMTALGPMVVARRPVLTGSDSGDSAGSLIMGRFVTGKMVERLNEQTGIKFSVNEQPSSLLKAEKLHSRKNPEIKTIEVSKDLLIARMTFADIEGKAALNVVAEIPRTITMAGRKTVYVSLAIILSASTIVILALLITTQKTVIGPLTMLAGHAEKIGASQDLSLRLKMVRKDEIGRLSRAFDNMIQKLEQAISTTQKSEEMFRSLTESSLAHVIMIQEGKFLYVNPSGARDLELPPEQLVGRNAADLIHPEDRPIAMNWARGIIPKNNHGDRFECRYLTPDGKTKWIQMVATSLVYEGKPTILIHGMDITDRVTAEQERLRLEGQLRRAEKMEAMGLMAGGVAHDLNNMLGGVVGYSELLLMDLPEENHLKKHVNGIMQSGQRAAAMIQDMLALTRRGVVISEVTSLNDVINDYINSPEYNKLRSYYPEVDIIVQLEKDLLRIKGSPVHLAKAVMNLVSNAAEAISDKGRIIIKTENRHLDRVIKGYDSVNPGDYAVLVVADNGAGISKEDIGRIFEPFYTKKVMGRSGTGLGLAVVWGTVKDHNGYIDVQSQVGEGTCFSLYFPATGEMAVKVEKSLSLEKIKGRGEHILVVDDVKGQRELAEAMLKNLGYNVVTAAGGEEAVSYIRSNKFDLVVLDMIMDPGIDGLTTYRQILAVSPGQKAIIVSGFSETDRVKEAQKLGAGPYVRKPYLLETIGVAVKNELDRDERKNC
ncbi:MAG: response regulator [Desulfobacteraceae bacterium]|nr:MAG: response regulator [Desulfobacteraceae bacterium]